MPTTAYQYRVHYCKQYNCVTARPQYKIAQPAKQPQHGYLLCTTLLQHKDAVAGAAEDLVVTLDLHPPLQTALLQLAVYLVVLLALYAAHPAETDTSP